MVAVGSKGPARRLALAGGMLALVAIGAGCAASAQPVGSGGSVVPNVNVGGLPAGITVSGEGEVTGTPDTLSISFGVSTKRASVDQAVGDNATTSTAVLDTLKGKSIAESDIQTQNYSIQPSFAYAEGKQVPDGYTVNNTVSVKLHDVKGAGGVIDAVSAAGGDDVVVQGVSFSLEDDDAQLKGARDKAFADAKAKAETKRDNTRKDEGKTPAEPQTPRERAEERKEEKMDYIKCVRSGGNPRDCRH